MNRRGSASLAPLTENLQVTFAKVAFEDQPQKRDGSLGGNFHIAAD